MSRYRNESAPPPPELLVYDEAVWVDRVDPTGYDEKQHRIVREGVPYGPVQTSFEEWRAVEARARWVRARIDWAREHGWPGGLTGLDLLRLEVQERREEHLQGCPDRVQERHDQLGGHARLGQDDRGPAA